MTIMTGVKVTPTYPSGAVRSTHVLSIKTAHKHFDGSQRCQATADAIRCEYFCFSNDVFYSRIARLSAQTAKILSWLRAYFAKVSLEKIETQFFYKTELQVFSSLFETHSEGYDYAVWW